MIGPVPETPLAFKALTVIMITVLCINDTAEPRCLCYHTQADIPKRSQRIENRTSLAPARPRAGPAEALGPIGAGPSPSCD